MWTLLTVLLIIGGAILVPYSIALGALAFVGAFVTGGLAYGAKRDLELFMGVCLMCAAFIGLKAVIDKLW